MEMSDNSIVFNDDYVGAADFLLSGIDENSEEVDQMKVQKWSDWLSACEDELETDPHKKYRIDDRELIELLIAAERIIFGSLDGGSYTYNRYNGCRFWLRETLPVMMEELHRFLSE